MQTTKLNTNNILPLTCSRSGTCCFGKAVIIVDTHMKRISHHIGLTVNTNPDKIEFDLKKIVPEAKQTVFSHKIVAHGRSICIARRPKCTICPILKYCRYGQENV